MENKNGAEVKILQPKEFKIEKGIPIPERKRIHWPHLEVGECLFFEELKDANKFSCAAYHRKWRVARRRIFNGYRVWRIL